MPPGRSNPGRSDTDLDALLADAHRAVVRRVDTDRGSRGAPPPPRGRPHRTWLLACIAAWLALLAVLVVPPKGFRGPSPRPYTPPPGLEEASLRWGLWLAHGRVEAYRAAARRLPSRLGETGFDDRLIELEVRDADHYRLVANHGPDPLVLDDGMDVDRFLGTALDELRAAP